MGLYFVKRGKVRLYKLNADGEQFTLDILSEGNVFGEMDIISLGTRLVYRDGRRMRYLLDGHRPI